MDGTTRSGGQTCPWETLGVSPWDDSATIRKAWLALVRRYHPDLAQNDKEAANRRLAEINNAFDVVSDPEAARRKINELRRAEAARRAKTAARPGTEKRTAPTRETPRAEEKGTRQDPARRRPDARTTGSSRPEMRRDQSAREAFDRALRILSEGPRTRARAIYL